MKPGEINTLTVLEKFAFYRDAPRFLQMRIAAAAQHVHLPADACFYRQGDTCGQFALVGAGSIRVFKVGEGGREITLYHVRDGETCLINMLCVLLGQRAVASAVTDSPVDAVIIPANAAREWVDTDRVMRNFVLETMGQRLVDVMTLVEEIAFRRVDDRLARLLLRRFASFRVIPATHEELAAELGTAREVVSRLLKEFERRGAIGIARGQIDLRDEQVLRELPRSG